MNPNSVSLYILIIASFASLLQGAASVDEAETDLLALYHHTRGPEWIRNDGWREAAESASPPSETAVPPRWCNWFGLECEKRVATASGDTYYVLVGLSLGGNNLRGTLPLRVMCKPVDTHGAFVHLRTLNVSNNVLEGDAPLFSSHDSACPRGTSSINRHLMSLDISQNAFNASMDMFLAKMMPRLRFVRARNNRLSGPILEPHEAMVATRNEFAAPASATDGDGIRFPSLEVFDVGFNRLLGRFPTAAFASHTPHLRELRLDNNFLVDQTLSWLHVGSAEGVGSGLGWRHTLTTIHLQNNYIQASIPAAIAHLSALQEVVLDGNRIYGTIPRDIRELRQLQKLSLAHNFLRGPLPCAADKWFSEQSPFVQLTFLDVTDNDLDGPVCEVSSEHSIEVLRLADNSFSGHIPSISGRHLREVTLGGENRWLCELPDHSAIPAWIDRAPSTKCMMTLESSLTPPDAQTTGGGKAEPPAAWFGEAVGGGMFSSTYRKRRGGDRNAAHGQPLSIAAQWIFSAFLCIFLISPIMIAVVTAAGVHLPDAPCISLPSRFLQWIQYQPLPSADGEEDDDGEQATTLERER